MLFTAFRHLAENATTYLRPVIVDRDADIVFLYELLDARQSPGVGSRNNHSDAARLQYSNLERIRIFIFAEGMHGSVNLIRPRIAASATRFLLRIHWKDDL